MRYTNTRKYHIKGKVAGSIFSKIFSFAKKIIPKVTNVIRKVAPRAKQAINYTRKAADFYNKNQETINKVANKVLPPRFTGIYNKASNFITDDLNNALDKADDIIDKTGDVINKISPAAGVRRGGFMISDKQDAGRLFLGPGGNMNVDMGFLESYKKKPKSKLSAQERLRARINKKK